MSYTLVVPQAKHRLTRRKVEGSYKFATLFESPMQEKPLFTRAASLYGSSYKRMIWICMLSFQNPINSIPLCICCICNIQIQMYVDAFACPHKGTYLPGLPSKASFERSKRIQQSNDPINPVSPLTRHVSLYTPTTSTPYHIQSATPYTTPHLLKKTHLVKRQGSGSCTRHHPYPTTLFRGSYGSIWNQIVGSNGRSWKNLERKSGVHCWSRLSLVYVAD